MGLAALVAASCPPSTPDFVLKIETSGGVLNGYINASASSVRQFLGVPFALPPTGNRRWQPPSKLESAAPINTTNIGPACPQQPISATPTLSFFPLDDFSEDCLTLNVWTPKAPRNLLPVFVWYFGGGFVQGGTNSLYFNPQSWVQRTQSHIVVTVNFRSNIFGFPNAAGLTYQNLGLLDQRLALEWVRENIASFGGDPSKIVTWGESAGAIAIDYLNFAYLEDPITSGTILESGTALFPPQLFQSFDTAQVNFSTLAASFGCAVALSPVDCLKNVTWQDIQASMVKLNLTSSFLPVVDERLVFSNYTQRYEMGAYSSVPAIIGTNQHEVNALIPPTPGVVLNGTQSDKATNATFLCTAAAATQLRQATGRTTYRYRYDGNFPNISPYDFLGAYHAAELPLIFGTAGDYHGVSTLYEDSVSRMMQDMWVEFARDPLNGLRNVGWGSYADGRAVLIGEHETPFRDIDISQLDSICNGLSPSLG
ncbi:alpha/beta-hydrolase [Thozetella sp. PMI_491]|nr:alpha/beta-hydrolase [Thozetella sp. PMI_491]